MFCGGRKQESDKAKLGDPELYLLKALKQDCQQQPLIFIDTYERLQAASEISQQKIKSRYSRPHDNPIAGRSMLPRPQGFSLSSKITTASIVRDGDYKPRPA